MSKAIGIDLGTTNSAAAVRTMDTRVLQNKENEDLTPSAVSMHKGKMLIGRYAVTNMGQVPEDTIISVKRLMGRAFRDSEVQRVREKYLYQVVEPQDGTDDDVRVIMGGKQYSPPEISSILLKKIKEDAELRLSDQVEYAVITVPAYFTDKQRNATREAGRRAGFKVQKILDEPTAAAIAFGIDNLGPEDSKTVLVYDLGGGTFDVSVLTIVGGVFAQLNITGDMWLGGDDFDFRIVEHVVDHVKAVHQVDPRPNRRFMAQLKLEAEKAKKALSSMTSTDIIVNGILQDENKDFIDVELELTRSQFERMIAERVKESVELVREAMKGAQVTAEQIDHVLLVGGSSCIPMVRRELTKVFDEKKLMMNVDPMKCVAYGAAILSAKLANSWECGCGHRNEGKHDMCQNCGAPSLDGGGGILAPTTGMHYGIETKGDLFGVIIPKGSSFPTPEPVVKRFFTPIANLKRVKVPIYAGFKDAASANELQAIVWLQLPDNVPADTPLDVAFSLDDDGILQKVKVSLRDGSGTEVETYLDRGDSKRSRLEKKLEQMRKRKQELGREIDAESERNLEGQYGQAAAALSNNDTEAAERCVQQMDAVLQRAAPAEPWKQRAESLISYTEFVVAEFGWLIDPSQTIQLKNLVDALRRTVERGNQPEVEAKAKELDAATDDLPGAVTLLVILVRAIGRATSDGKLAAAEQVRAARSDIESLMRRGDHQGAMSRFQQIEGLLKDILGGPVVPGSSKDVHEDVVKQ
jgi:molecular chaperone DnaK